MLAGVAMISSVVKKITIKNLYFIYITTVIPWIGNCYHPTIILRYCTVVYKMTSFYCNKTFT